MVPQPMTKTTTRKMLTTRPSVVGMSLRTIQIEIPFESVMQTFLESQTWVTTVVGMQVLLVSAPLTTFVQVLVVRVVSVLHWTEVVAA